MILYYNNKNEYNLPKNITLEKCDPLEVKSKLKALLEKYEGKEYVSLFIYDEIIDSELNISFVDYFLKYLNLDIFDITIIDPQKIYDLNNTYSYSVYMDIKDRSVMNKVNSIKQTVPTCKVNLIDDFMMVNIQPENEINNN